ncbi:hypothetical protein FZEAL_2512 [Fusarium zealandicum]|uniref:DUF6604 domain-containing protein n=1 Tax=Fusarium zealandicum TaxID=1053134 RepID=A0A8H4XNS6_9HYPO|nr:hypothetical protein FZEAL_2512 [Fusarium zealandicum]
MAPHNIYLCYKRDTKYLLYWMINVSNRLIRTVKGDEGVASLEVNTTGQITVNGITSMAKLIAERDEHVPGVIYRLFGSIIEARTTINSAFQQLVGSDPDEDLKRSNASHKHFIDTLSEAFSVLGGDTWAKTNDKSAEDPDEDDDVERIIFLNKFRNLTVENEDDGSSEEEDGGPANQTHSAPRRASKKSGKGKKGKKGKKAKKPKNGAKKISNKETASDEIPLESIKIIQDENGIMTDYLLAVYSAIQEWIRLRDYTQSLWKEVAYSGLNGAAAGAVSNMAISMIRRTSAAIFVDYPGHDSYETIMKTITRGNPDTAQGMFIFAHHTLDRHGRPTKKPKETALNVKEQFLIHAYQDLLDFVKDFQANRTGKPTKAMQARIAKWDPTFNLQKATEQERLDWRRCYTIKWLYDLVNVYSAVVVQRNNQKGENHIYEEVDWSPTGPWGVHRTIFGINEFAGEVTSMAMKKPGFDVRKMIFPHHVFQLQCIVDAFTISRGWSLNALRGHVLEAPAKDFRPRRDVDLFLDRECDRLARGFIQAVHILKQVRQPERQENSITILTMMSDHFTDWLGESKYMHGLDSIPPSRFSDTNANGLWEYSPFLCGVGLMEGLQLSYSASMKLWDRMPEPMLLIHLHNILVNKGLLARPIGLFDTLQDIFNEALFVKGKVPTSNFGEALFAKLGETDARRREVMQLKTPNGDDHVMLDPSRNLFFRKQSFLNICRMAGWNPEAIPDSEVAVGTILFLQRIGRTKKVVDPKTKKARLEETPLVLRSRAEGLDEETILQMVDMSAKFAQGRDKPVIPQSVIDSLTPAGFQTMPSSSGRFQSLPLGSSKGVVRAASKSTGEMSGRDLLSLIKMDVASDVAGMLPLSSLNYVAVTIAFLFMFDTIEKRLKEQKSPVYVEAYEKPGPFGNEKRVGLTLVALAQQDDECLKIIADVFEEHRSGFMSYIYWDDLDTSPLTERSVGQDETGPGSGGDCVIM